MVARLTRAGVAATTALALSLPATALAAPDEDEASAPLQPEPYAEAQRLYDQGRVQFDTAEYRKAIELWTEAYANVPDAPDAARIKGLLIYNIATARERAFDVSQDLEQLRQAKILLEGFEDSIPALYGEDEIEAESARVRQRIDGITQRIADAEGTHEVEPPDEGPPPPPTDPGTDQPTHAGKGLMIGGAVALGLGAGLLGMMGAGLALGAGANDISGLMPDDIAGRRDQFARGRTGNALAIAGGAAGGVFMVTGAVLLGLGLAKRRTLALAPGPGQVGLGISARF